MSESKFTKNTLERVRKGAVVLDSFIDALLWNEALDSIIDWGRKRESRSVCLCNVHSSVTAITDDKLRAALSDADMVLPDGAPVAWMLRRKGFKKQTRIAGPDMMEKLCKQLEGKNIGVFIFGAAQETLNLLEEKLKLRFPELRIDGAVSPAFGEWNPELEQQYIDQINSSGAGIIFVGLGCPKQEIWMAKVKPQIDGVLLGVGAAFDFHAGTVKRAPQFIQNMGLEWLHRLSSQPQRLFKRYFQTNSKFIWFAAKDLLLRQNNRGS